MMQEPIVTVGDLRKALEKVPDHYEVIGNVMNCVANIKTVVVHTNEPLVILYDRAKSPTKPS